MADHHSFSVIDHRYRQSYSADDKTFDFLTEQLEIARKEIDTLRKSGLAVPQRVDASARLYMALSHLDRFIPEVEGFVCGYYWNKGNSWSGFSAHNTKAHAESWLPYWQAEVPSRGKDMWIVRKTTCQIGKFVTGGPPPIPTPEETQ